MNEDDDLKELMDRLLCLGERPKVSTHRLDVLKQQIERLGAEADAIKGARELDDAQKQVEYWQDNYHRAAAKARDRHAQFILMQRKYDLAMKLLAQLTERTAEEVDGRVKEMDDLLQEATTSIVKTGQREWQISHAVDVNSVIDRKDFEQFFRAASLTRTIKTTDTGV